MNRNWTYRLHIFLFLLPALILFCTILIAPIFISFRDSLYSFSNFTGSDKKYVGLTNQLELTAATEHLTETIKVELPKSEAASDAESGDIGETELSLALGEDRWNEIKDKNPVVTKVEELPDGKKVTIEYEGEEITLDSN